MKRRKILINCLTLTGGSVGLCFVGVPAGAMATGDQAHRVVELDLLMSIGKGLSRRVCICLK